MQYLHKRQYFTLKLDFQTRLLISFWNNIQVKSRPSRRGATQNEHIVSQALGPWMSKSS